MNRHFRLSTVERMRATGVDHAARALGAARRDLVDAESALSTLREQIDACVPPVQSTPTDVSSTAVRREALRDLAQQADAEVARLRAALATATAGWHAARSDLRAVESLHDRHREALAADDARRDQRLADDLASVVRAFPGLGRPATVGPTTGGDAA